MEMGGKMKHVLDINHHTQKVVLSCRYILQMEYLSKVCLQQLHQKG